MIPLLHNNPLLLLFLVAAVGYPRGRIKIGGSSLGLAPCCLWVWRWRNCIPR